MDGERPTIGGSRLFFLPTHWIFEKGGLGTNGRMRKDHSMKENVQWTEHSQIPDGLLCARRHLALGVINGNFRGNPQEGGWLNSRGVGYTRVTSP